MDLSPQSLEANPHLILPGHSKALKKFDSTDGLVGAVIANGHYIITSPNCDFIPAPPLGNRVVSLNHDLRFGQDDPLEWPQFFHPELPHLACLPKRTPQALFSLRTEIIMWEVPCESDFTYEAVLFIGLRELKYSKFRGMVSLIEETLEQFLRLPWVREGMPLTLELHAMLQNFLHHVEFSQKDPRRMCLYVREAQRTYLELRACLDYVKLYKPAMETGTGGIFTGSTPSNVRGAITFDPDVCQSLYRANIPVWLIRPSTALASIYVKTLTVVREYESPIQLARGWSFHGDPPIFDGPEGSLEKYVALRQHTLILHDTLMSRFIPRSPKYTFSTRITWGAGVPVAELN